MKFNFEKIKNTTKKTALVAGAILSATFLPSEKLSAQKILNIHNAIGKPEDQRNDYLEYMNHPSYKLRLAKEMFGDRQLTSEEKNMVDNEYYSRILSLKNAHINVVDFFGKPLKYNRFLPPDQVEFNPTSQDLYGRYHEFSHVAEKATSPEDDSSMLNTEGFTRMKDKLIKTINEDTPYYNRNTEIKARINALRLEAYKKYGYDLNTNFNINNYPELLKTKGYLELKDILKMKNKDINKISKYIAINNDINNYYVSSLDYENHKNDNT